jgi:hypothetical protein
MFLRTGCTLPDGIDLVQEQFCEKWMSAADTMAVALNAGWHFMWLEGTYSRPGAGRTVESAIAKAVALALNQVNGRFHAAELDSISVRKYPGFLVAKVTLHARHIQHAAMLGQLDEMPIPTVPAR